MTSEYNRIIINKSAKYNYSFNTMKKLYYDYTSAKNIVYAAEVQSKFGRIHL